MSYNKADLPLPDFDIEYLSVEYLSEDNREDSPVVFNLKTVIDDDTGESYYRYAVYRVFMEPNRGGSTGPLGSTGCIRVQRLPNVKGENSDSEATKAGPNCPLAPDSLAEFYLNFRRRSLAFSKEGENKRAFLTFCSAFGHFEFYQPDMNTPYKYCDSRDFICQVFALLLNKGFLQNASVIGDAPRGFRTKVMTKDEKYPYTTDSKIDFSAVISNLFYCHGDRRHVQGVYQPVIKGRFIDQESNAEKGRQVPKDIRLPYNQNKAEIDQERARCAKRIHEGLGLRTPFYRDWRVAETTKRFAETTNTDKNTVRGTNTAASSPRLNSQPKKKQPLLPSATGTPRGSESVSKLSSPVAGAMAKRATASNAGDNRVPSSISRPAANADPGSRMASARAASSMPPSAGGSATQERGNKYTR